MVLGRFGGTVARPSRCRCRPRAAAQQAAESGSRWSQKLSTTSGSPVAAARCSRRASSARNASPVERDANGWHQSGTEPSPTAASQRWPSSPRTSRTLRSAGQGGGMDGACGACSSEWSRRDLPLAVAPRISTTRQPSGQAWAGESGGNSSCGGVDGLGAADVDGCWFGGSAAGARSCGQTTSAPG